jgi:ribonucleoside-diphosphate reductase alpha chain
MLKTDKRMSAKVVATTKEDVKTNKAKAKFTEFVPKIQKRDGKIVDFDVNRIENAIHKAMIASEEGSRIEAELVANKVVADLVRIGKRYPTFLPTVEGAQDAVEKELILSDYVKTAKSYILYRESRSKLREKGVVVPEQLKKLYDEASKYFKGNALGEFVYLRSYAKWIESEGRRETWIETVDRYMDFMKENLGKKLTSKEYDEVRNAILKQEAMPSMRLMQFAGDAARRCNVAAYNCSFVAPTKIEDFAEIMYVSMCGSGVGYSVENTAVHALPQIQKQTGEKLRNHTVADSKEGWCEALTLGLQSWYRGRDVDFDFSQIRPAGARLKTMGGKASGPAPLMSLLSFAREKILAKQGRRLSTLDAHDIICKIGDCVVAGGVRRSAMISLSDLDDELLRNAKTGQFYISEPQRSIANNSAIYEAKPTNTEFMDEWVALMKSGTGERGIFNRGGLPTQLPARRVNHFEKKGILKGGTFTKPIGTNPCGEIILQSKQFCNLTEVICRADDTEATLLRKIRVATILGTYQSSLTNFKFLSPDWKKNCEEERLLGVSLSGQWDSKVARDGVVLEKLRKESIKVNKQYAKKFGISQSTTITCVKPSGTVSQTVNCASGMHPRHAPYYIRRVRISATDSLFKMLRDQGVPYHPEVGQTKEGANTYVLEFPVASPKGSIYKNDLSALDQLRHWKVVKMKYTEHNPSVTISVGEEEWIAVANWLYENWDILGGLSFLPRSNHVYQLAPYEEISEETYDELKKRFANVDYSKLITYERADETEMKRELACAGGTCEI